MFKSLVGLFLVFTVVICNCSATEFCYSEIVSACSLAGGETQNCTSKYGAAHTVLKDLQNYANLHITRNWQFMLMSSHFSNYVKNRDGFAKLYKKYSDESWEDSIELIKYIAKRGGAHDFKFRKDMPSEIGTPVLELDELPSLAKALGMWKTVAEEGHYIHGEISNHRLEYHDPETSSFIENEFVHEHAKTIRELAGHTNDLKRLVHNAADSSLAVFLFDNYLQKSA
ncbi:ferritin family protein [Providencia sp. PROV040]|uniref:ferritin family protein n=1 Tax=Providencia sp. PROV040 TaxID=2949771 RepID=UPI00234A100D|nr:ferritin [Providencia sp. PROV040]